MTKQEILEHFKDINHAYNESTRLDDLSHMLDELMQGNSDKDCISREQAIRIAEQGQLLGYEWQFKELCKLPSIQPKKMGHWLYRVVGIYRYASCSECNKMQVDESNYCPNCGAKMAEEEENNG